MKNKQEDVKTSIAAGKHMLIRTNGCTNPSGILTGFEELLQNLR